MFERLIRGSLGPYAVFSRIRGEFFPKDPPAEFFPDASWQRCVVHFYRNVFSHVPSPKMREVASAPWSWQTYWWGWLPYRCSELRSRHAAATDAMVREPIRPSMNTLWDDGASA